MNKQEQRIIETARKVLDNWLYGEINADVSGDFNELESAFKDYEHPSSMDFDWQSFRNQAAKDILCAMISSTTYCFAESTVDSHTGRAIRFADALITKLKEKEEK